LPLCCEFSSDFLGAFNLNCSLRGGGNGGDGNGGGDTGGFTFPDPLTDLFPTTSTTPSISSSPTLNSTLPTYVIRTDYNISTMLTFDFFQDKLNI
jgi:hypothetical protein